MPVVSSLVCFGLSVLLAATFVGSYYFGIHLPVVSDLGPKSEITLLAAYVLLLVGIILDSATKEKATGTSATLQNQTILRTVAASAGIVAAVFAVLTFWYEQQRSVYATTLQLLVELEKSRPTNPRFCRCAVTEMDNASIKALRDRKQATLTARGADLIRTCFSDLKKEDLGDYFVNELSLSRRGAAAFAAKLNAILGGDENIAFAAINGIANREMVTRELAESLAVDKIVVKRLNDALKTQLFPNITDIDLGRHSKKPQRPAEELCKEMVVDRE